ncbi:MAG: hypothetical protein H7A25_17255 [Leptospiraceae bacterium]|nr:hypothetical protein [Leptospiraceae bacterium]MCP5501653.1 hypothetical protein [Leptospiraceae bacterium]
MDTNTEDLLSRKINSLGKSCFNCIHYQQYILVSQEKRSQTACCEVVDEEERADFRRMGIVCKLYKEESHLDKYRFN